ncbi:Myc-type, basic helix-loop-helix domain-containing protein [Chlamydoabsidia padenii]|nr:Myc-type, basic helix-loop-helix domain-containing protein [Chlamydoabsidia padenii]
MSHMVQQDGHTSPIDFTNSDGLFMSPLSRPNQFDDFEDLDYQSGLTSYQKQHLRHPPLQSFHSTTTTTATIPIHSPPLKQDNITSSYPDNNLSSFPMSAPANIGQFGDQAPLMIQQHHHPIDSPRSTPRSFEEDDYTLQMNMQVMMDKRRRRRESHNAVERRRRENINERIQELGTLLPDNLMEASSNNNNKPNKGAILRHSVDNIRQLQQQVQSYSQQVKELEATLARLQST